MVRVGMHLLSNRHFSVHLLASRVEEGSQRVPAVEDDALPTCAACCIHIEHESNVIQFRGVCIDVTERPGKSDFFGSESDETDGALERIGSIRREHPSGFYDRDHA